MSSIDERYPRTVEVDGHAVVVAPMRAADADDVLAFARRLPPHDLLFLRRDITEPKVMTAWVDGIGAGEISSLIARRGDTVIGCTAVVRDPLSWSSHVGELRVLLAPSERSHGLGRMLIQECFLVALAEGLDKLVAFMTPDQKAAIEVFEDLGFRGEALLLDHVEDRQGVRHDLVILGHDVQRFHAQLEAFGVTEAF